MTILATYTERDTGIVLTAFQSPKGYGLKIVGPRGDLLFEGADTLSRLGWGSTTCPMGTAVWDAEVWAEALADEASDLCDSHIDKGDTLDVTLWVCVDCLMALVNGDSVTPEHDRALDDGIERQESDGYTVLPCGPLPWEPDGADAQEFSWSSCDLCLSHLGGSRHRFIAVKLDGSQIDIGETKRGDLG